MSGDPQPGLYWEKTIITGRIGYPLDTVERFSQMAVSRSFLRTNSRRTRGTSVDIMYNNDMVLRWVRICVTQKTE